MIDQNLIQKKMAELLMLGDSSGEFCNGKVSGNDDAQKLKKLLAKKKDIFVYVHSKL